MRTENAMRKSEVGELRPSQVLHTFGIGAIVDLPNLSVMVMGLEDWPIAHSNEIGEWLEGIRPPKPPKAGRLCKGDIPGQMRLGEW